MKAGIQTKGMKFPKAKSQDCIRYGGGKKTGPAILSANHKTGGRVIARILLKVREERWLE